MSTQETTDFLTPESVAAHLSLQPRMQVADFGSGSGEFTLWAAAKVGPEGKVTAVDVRQEALDALRPKLTAEHDENVVLVRGNLEKPGSSMLADGSQDAVMIVNMLFQSEKKAEVLHEAFRVLKPRGTLMIIDWKPATDVLVGPPKSLRVDAGALAELVRKESGEEPKSFDAGAYHFGLLTHKR